ncbi:MAG: CRISPR-associated endonuclease Cas6 [Rhodocyclaceae bacterium]|nr:CRISPR-associated endonuclease Cas6 [Rhodocyclaceae bacterium]
MSLMSTLRAAGAVEKSMPAAMVDLSFALEGDSLPHHYPFALEAALLEALPWLAEEENFGVHPIRGPVTDFGLMLPRRAKLVLRLPAERVEAALALSGRSLAIGPESVRLGAAKPRPIEPFATLRAWNVATSAGDEQGFVEAVSFQLEVLGVKARLICDRPEILGDGVREIRGFGLVLHDLSPAHSLLVQARGLGPERRLGCGVFVHHKIIEGLGADPD